LTIQAMSGVGLGFFRAIVVTQLTLVILAAPAAAAGAICQDRSSGKLRQLLATDLTDSEIVLGKLAARLVPVLGLVCCALPVISLSSLLGGVDPLALAGAFLVTPCLAVFGCTVARAFSVWASKPYEVLLATYAVIGINSWRDAAASDDRGPIKNVTALSKRNGAKPRSTSLHCQGTSRKTDLRGDRAGIPAETGDRSSRDA
jgi:hypothetical protein